MAKLEIFIDSLEDVHEDLRENYVKDGDRFKLNFDLIKDHEGVAKVRKTANDLDKKAKDAAKELADVLEKYGDLDPEAAKAALDAIEQAGDKELMDEGKVEEVIEKRTEKMKADHEKQMEAKDKIIEEMKAGATALTGELSSIKIYDAVKDAALSKGARKDALTDIANRAKGVWSLKDGNPTALDENGDAIFGKSGEALSITEWVEGLATDAEYLFEPNSGGGAKGGDGGGSGGDGNQKGIKTISPSAAGDNIAAIAAGEAVVDRG
jgi:hypothetical protein